MKAKTATLLICLLILMIGAACNQGSQPTVKVSPQVTPAKHYQLKGKVVNIDQQSKMVNIDCEAIPGFMEAMTMPYKVNPESELDKLHAGDTITGDLVVQDDGAWLENVTVTGHAPASAAK